MSRRFITYALAAAACMAVTAQEPAQPDYDAAAAALFAGTLRQTIDDMGNNGVSINRDRFLDLFVRAYRGEDVGLSADEANDLIMTAMGLKRPPSVPSADAEAETAWVEAQMALPRTERLEGGVVLQRLVEGSGECPPPGSVVMVMYTGRLSSGQEFDKTDQPFALPLDHVVPGLSTAMQQMHLGGTYRVFIPPAMGYGTEAVMDLIPGNSALDFTIELQEIKQ